MHLQWPIQKYKEGNFICNSTKNRKNFNKINTKFIFQNYKPLKYVEEKLINWINIPLFLVCKTSQNYTGNEPQMDLQIQ
jgi:hypothetical protein